MFKLFNRRQPTRLWDFNGGIHPPEMKTQSSLVPLRRLSLAKQYVIPLQQHLGTQGELLVATGDKVAKGQPLTRGAGRALPVHASTSGTITAIAPHISSHPSGLPELSIFLQSDGEDRWYARQPCPDYHNLSRDTLLARIHQAGIAGLGGAGFPTASKLQGGLEQTRTLIINAAECEPYITADDRLMQEHADEIVQGINILCYILQPQRVLIGIEDNKPQAISAWREALSSLSAPQGIEIALRVIPTKYPSGGAKQLTRILTGLEVPKGKHSASIGVLMHNVGTVYAIKRAIIDGEPLIERVVTLTGEAMQRPGNVWARLGTPVSHLLDDGHLLADANNMVIMGGPLMGFTLPSLDVPVVKITNCLLAPSLSEMGETQAEQACIRCGLCAEACPADLLPQQLYWFSRGDEHDKARKHHLFDCIECGACAYVCPSQIPLVHYYRQEKAQIRQIDQDNQRAASAKVRFEAKKARMEQEKQRREARHQQARIQPKASPEQPATPTLPGKLHVPPRQLTGLKAMQPLPGKTQVKSANTAPTASASEDPRQAALAAAIARVKAKKAAEQAGIAPDSATTSNTEQQNDTARKAAVAAAIARVQARKAATAPVTPPAVSPDSPSSADRKAMVEAAIARAKARKQAQNVSNNEE